MIKNINQTSLQRLHGSSIPAAAHRRARVTQQHPAGFQGGMFFFNQPKAR
jgi:hypothetical protein